MIDADCAAEIERAATALVERLHSLGLRTATAESCTGGLVAGAITAVPGSSNVFEGGYVTYSDRAKRILLGVPSELLEHWGAVSEPVAGAMAEGAVARLGADIAVAITGIAGPGGATALKPVGLVHFAAASRKGRMLHQVRHFGEVGRSRVRSLSVLECFALLNALLDSESGTAT